MTPEPIRLVEAALFSSGKPIDVAHIAEATGLKPDEVRDALKKLEKEYRDRDTALEVVKSGPRWAMAVRTAYADSTRMLAEAEIPRKVLKTLALIAFHQPLKQSDLKNLVGSVVYDHVKELHERGMVTARHEGVTKILQTTDRFIDYFGMDAEDPEQIRTILAKRVGLELPPAKPRQVELEDVSQSAVPDGAESDAGPPEDADEADGSSPAEGEAQAVAS